MNHQPSSSSTIGSPASERSSGTIWPRFLLRLFGRCSALLAWCRERALTESIRSFGQRSAAGMRRCSPNTWTGAASLKAMPSSLPAAYCPTLSLYCALHRNVTGSRLFCGSRPRSGLATARRSRQSIFFARSWMRYPTGQLDKRSGRWRMGSESGRPAHWPNDASDSMRRARRFFRTCRATPVRSIDGPMARSVRGLCITRGRTRPPTLNISCFRVKFEATNHTEQP